MHMWYSQLSLWLNEFTHAFPSHTWCFTTSFSLTLVLHAREKNSLNYNEGISFLWPSSCSEYVASSPGLIQTLRWSLRMIPSCNDYCMGESCSAHSWGCGCSLTRHHSFPCVVSLTSNQIQGLSTRDELYSRTLRLLNAGFHLENCSSECISRVWSSKSREERWYFVEAQISGGVWGHVARKGFTRGHLRSLLTTLGYVGELMLVEIGIEDKRFLSMEHHELSLKVDVDWINTCVVM